ncbi:MAG: DUF4199 domain-containing protein [Bacteroidetes bacterium]|nr:DUF4199 domain-containing protein [Bacteroidota bacterium]
MKIGISVKLGIIAGLINCIAWYAFAKSLGFYSVEVYIYRNYVTLGVLITGIFLTIFLTKKGNQGFLEFSEGLKAGVLYSLMLAVVIGIFNYLYFKFITPDTIDFFLSEAKKSEFAKTLTGDELNKFLVEERSTFNSFKLVPPILFFGLISSLLASAIFRRKNPAISDSEN